MDSVETVKLYLEGKKKKKKQEWWTGASLKLHNTFINTLYALGFTGSNECYTARLHLLPLLVSTQ